MSFSLKLEIIFYIYDSDRLCGGYQSGLKDNPLSAFSCQESHQSGRKCSLWVIDKDIHFMGQRIFFTPDTACNCFQEWLSGFRILT